MALFFAKTASKKIGALIRSMKFLLWRLLCISVNQPYGHAWNTIVISGLVLSFSTFELLDKLKKQICRTVDL